MTKEQRDYSRFIADKYGFDKQKIVLFEEMAELQKSVCKYSRAIDSGKDDPNIWKSSIAQEIADVEIMLVQIMHLTGISAGRVNKEIGDKIQRQIMRIKGERQ